MADRVMIDEVMIDEVVANTRRLPAGLLLLADGRFPSGGHTQSGGVEAAVLVGDVGDVESLERYLLGRLSTTGRVDAAFSATACALTRRTEDLVAAIDTLDAEYSARTMSPYLREVSRRQGRQLLRSAREIWPSPWLDLLAEVEGGPHQPVVLGATVGAAGGDPIDAATIALHHLASAVATAAVRLLGLDPVALAGVQASVASTIDGLAVAAAESVDLDASVLPADGGALTEILGQHHGGRDARLFVA
jgi:urease accessory protein